MRQKAQLLALLDIFKFDFFRSLCYLLFDLSIHLLVRFLPFLRTIPGSANSTDFLFESHDLLMNLMMPVDDIGLNFLPIPVVLSLRGKNVDPFLHEINLSKVILKSFLSLSPCDPLR